MLLALTAFSGLCGVALMPLSVLILVLTALDPGLAYPTCVSGGTSYLNPSVALEALPVTPYFLSLYILLLSPSQPQHDYCSKVSCAIPRQS